MDGATTRKQKVFIEVLWHRKSHEERKAEDELCSEAIQVAELEKSQTSRSCPKIIQQLEVDLNQLSISNSKSCYKTN